jgi:hypothetical protein
MAKWINFHVTGGHDNSGAASTEDGDNLLLADTVTSIAVTSPTNDGMQAVLNLSTGGGPTTCTVLVGLNADASDPGVPGAKPSTSYIEKLKEAINRAITANPGGVKSTVSLPLDQDNQAKYDFSKTVYFKSFKVA